MIKNAEWSCEWCGDTKPLSWLESLFSWLQPRYCAVYGEAAGWPSPSCRLSARLAERIAARTAATAKKKTLKELRGLTLGRLRGNDLAAPSNTAAGIMNKGFDGVGPWRLDDASLDRKTTKD